MTVGQFVIGFAIVAIAVIAVFLIAADVWRPYLSRGLGMAQAIPDATEADRSQWPTDEYANVQTRAERLELEPAEHIGGDTLVLVGPGFVHMRCRDARRDGGTPCTECVRILGGVRA
jgi:hypothetical protein